MSKSRTAEENSKPLDGLPESWYARAESPFGTLNKEFLEKPMKPEGADKRKQKVLSIEGFNKILRRACREQRRTKPMKKEVRNSAKSRR
jgi:hypothetical protein